jgi:hypothetical protein
LRLIAAALLLTAAGTACGKRGNPLPPVRPIPGRINDATARRIGDRVEVRFTVPPANLDNSTPPSVTRLDVYAAAGPPTPPGPGFFPPAPFPLPVPGRPIMMNSFPPSRIWTPPAPPAPTRRGGAPVTTGVQLLNAAYLRGHVDVRPPPPPVAAGDANAKEPPAPAASTTEPDPRPAPGEPATFTYDVSKERAAAGAEDLSVMRFMVVPIAGRNRPGPPSNVLELPLTSTLVPPSSPVVSYDERTITVTWTPTEPSQIFRIYRADSTGKEVLPALTPGPIGTPLYSAPVEFGVERCFVVHSTIARGSAVVESEPTAPVCKTPVDTFPPAAPDGLIALPSEGKIQLKWNAVDAADLAGYLVLRAEGAAAPEPVTASPVSETAFDDTTTKAGVRYVYVVVAVDKAGNRSPSSNQVEETAR